MQSFTGGTELEEMDSVDEEPHGSPVSSSAVHTTKPSDTLRDAEEEDIIHKLGQSESEGVVVSVCVSPTVDFPAAEEEEELQQEQEEEPEQEQQEENEEEEDEDAQSEGLTYKNHQSVY